MPVPRHIIEQIKQLIPPLNGSLRKGQSGRVGVLGGALDYTGAPFFAAMSAQRTGADLSHVICSPTAAQAIKSYSPDLIVHPVLREDAPFDEVKSALESLLNRLHVLVIGPGLGREAYMLRYAREALALARERGMFVVFDADALWMLSEDVKILRGYRRAVITPNVAEFARLSDKLGLDGSVGDEEKAGLVSRALGGVTVLRKGQNDAIAIDTTGDEADVEASKVGQDVESENTSEKVIVDVEGGMRRCSGQGDVLSGVVGTFLAWGKCYELGYFGHDSDRIPVSSSRIPFIAAVGASMVTRTASRRAYAREGRSVVTQDMLSECYEQAIRYRTNTELDVRQGDRPHTGVQATPNKFTQEANFAINEPEVDEGHIAANRYMRFMEEPVKFKPEYDQDEDGFDGESDQPDSVPDRKRRKTSALRCVTGKCDHCRKNKNNPECIYNSDDFRCQRCIRLRRACYFGGVNRRGGGPPGSSHASKVKSPKSTSSARKKRVVTNSSRGKAAEVASSSMIELEVVQERLTRAKVELSIAQDIVDLLEKRKRETLLAMA